MIKPTGNIMLLKWHISRTQFLSSLKEWVQRFLNNDQSQSLAEVYIEKSYQVWTFAAQSMQFYIYVQASHCPKYWEFRKDW